MKKVRVRATLTIEVAVPQDTSIQALEHAIRYSLDKDFRTFLIKEEKREFFKNNETGRIK